MKVIRDIAAICITATMIAGCAGMAERLERVGREPEFRDVNTYQEDIVEEKVKSDVERGLVALDGTQPKKTPNSLWRPGARTFFRDQRARAVGDILKVVVTIQDKAKLDNKTERTRDGNSSIGVPIPTGMGAQLLPEKFSKSASTVALNSKDVSKGNGKVDRKETIETTIAATVVKILPSSNLMIRGTQEIRVNYELREVSVEGIVRPEDISSSNSVTLDQIAEARVSYGGRGHISDAQQDRYGKQVLDAILPF
jgi:flagellar L-ring protein FlgH